MNLTTPAYLLMLLTGLVWFGYEVSWQAAVALALTIYAAGYFMTSTVVMVVRAEEKTPDPNP